MLKMSLIVISDRMIEFNCMVYFNKFNTYFNLTINIMSYGMYGFDWLINKMKPI